MAKFNVVISGQRHFRSSVAIPGQRSVVIVTSVKYKPRVVGPNDVQRLRVRLQRPTRVQSSSAGRRRQSVSVSERKRRRLALRIDRGFEEPFGDDARSSRTLLQILAPLMVFRVPAAGRGRGRSLLRLRSEKLGGVWREPAIIVFT